ncbi:MAG TPA: O-antigen ligase family protein [Terriglobales bacterium]|nr:O-antigen ligase family protein [Terriglobales bacterium]
MQPSLAALICVVGIAGLFYLDRDRSLRTSMALWLPITWLLIVGSRPVSSWLGMGPTNLDAASQLVEGSPFDAVVFAILLALGIAVLVRRNKRTISFLTASGPILVYFGYCLVSVLWSDAPDLSLKRWLKAIGDLVMVLVVVTEREPQNAFRRLYSRIGFVLLPLSVLFIRYFEYLGRGYDPDGRPMNTGVTTNKNTLGVITLVISLGVLWRVLELLRAKHTPNRARHLWAQGILLAFGVAVLAMANSMTSVACFMLGSVLILATNLPVIRRQPHAVHVLVVLIVLGGGLVMLFGGQASVTHALGRESNLTGRTDIWAAVLPVVPNPIVGAGFENFWFGPRLDKVWSRLSQYMHVNEAHNGYIEVYLNLGWIGLFLIVVIVISGYRGAIGAFRRDPAFGSLMLAYVAASAIYSITEAGFRLLNPIWIFFLLAVIAAQGFAAGVGMRARQPVGASSKRTDRVAGGDALTPEYSSVPG